LPRRRDRSTDGLRFVTAAPACAATGAQKLQLRKIFGRVDIHERRKRPVNVERIVTMLLDDGLAAAFTS